jgi:hypothetical protein
MVLSLFNLSLCPTLPTLIYAASSLPHCGVACQELEVYNQEVQIVKNRVAAGGSWIVFDVSSVWTPLPGWILVFSLLRWFSMSLCLCTYIMLNYVVISLSTFILYFQHFIAMRLFICSSLWPLCHLTHLTQLPWTYSLTPLSFYIPVKPAPLSLTSPSRDPYFNLGGMITLRNLKMMSHSLCLRMKSMYLRGNWYTKVADGGLKVFIFFSVY